MDRHYTVYYVGQEKEKSLYPDHHIIPFTQDSHSPSAHHTPDAIASTRKRKLFGLRNQRLDGL